MFTNLSYEYIMSIVFVRVVLYNENKTFFYNKYKYLQEILWIIKS